MLTTHTQRFALGIEYQGTHFHGWQRQSHDAITIQAALEAALSQVAQVPIQVICAGRTDAGVHATYQVVHFETVVNRPAKAWLLGGNRYLTNAISIKWVRMVPEHFNARYSALYRRYQYVLYLGVSRPALFHDCITHYRLPLDVKAMQVAADQLVGEHDFSSFRAKDCQSKSARRNLHFLKFQQEGPYLMIDVQANAFLKHMVRNLVGSLLAVGNGSKPISWIIDVLLALRRDCAGVTAPPNGLFLVDVGYETEYQLPRPNISTLIPFPSAQSADRS